MLILIVISVSIKSVELIKDRFQFKLGDGNACF